jgi:hypothetical protein
VICALLLALSLSSWPSQSAQAPDFPKPEAPTPQATFKTKVSRVKIGGNVRKSLLLNGEPVEVDTTVDVVFSLVE